MARIPEELSRLARELGALSGEERARVLAEAGEERARVLAESGAQPGQALPLDWEPPQLGRGGAWIGGSLRREELYGDDGR